MKSVKLSAAILSLGLMATVSAHASPITYTFTGTFDGSLNDHFYSGEAFSITLTGDTANVTGTGLYNNLATTATFSVGSTTGTLGGTFNEIGVNDANGTIGFEQANSGFVVEGLTDSSLTTYMLNTTFPKVSAVNQNYFLNSTIPGAVSQTPNSSYVTSDGNLVFGNIETLNFQADILPTPLPSSFGLFAAALGMMGLWGFIAKRKSGNFSI